jgi:hypothetical protein
MAAEKSASDAMSESETARQEQGNRGSQSNRRDSALGISCIGSA